MSLYDGLGLDANEGGGKEAKTNISGWSSNMKLLQTHKELQKKKASLLNLKRRNIPSVAPVVDLRGRGRSDGPEVRFNHHTGKMERVDGKKDSPSASPMPQLKSSPFIATDGSSGFLGVVDEYDPLMPNEYDTYMKLARERRNRERDEARKRETEERERKRRERHKESGYDERESSDEERDRSPRRRDERNERRSGGAAIAPPPSLLEDTGLPEDTPNAYGMNSVASKIMAKMGYKEGEGLGRDNQGMSMALMVEKTSKRGGKIIHERDIQKMDFMGPPPLPVPAPTTNLLKNPSKVVLLRNMVGPGEVDEDLEAETIEECTKYGKILKCIIFELPGAIEEEAVRIFLEFEKVDSAIKAVIDLNGRFFGGRMLTVCFYNLDKFRRLELGDPVES